MARGAALVLVGVWIGALAGCQTTQPGSASGSESGSGPAAALQGPYIRLLNDSQTGKVGLVTFLPDDRVSVGISCAACSPKDTEWLPAKAGRFDRAQTATTAFFAQTFPNTPPNTVVENCMHDVSATILFVNAANVSRSHTVCGHEVTPISQTLRAMVNE